MATPILLVAAGASSEASFVSSALHRAGMDTLREASAAAAIARLEHEHGPDLVVLPGWGPDERASARQIRKVRPRIMLAFVVDPQSEAHARQALVFEPSIGHDAEVIAVGTELAPRLEELAEVASQRAKHRKLLAKINERMVVQRERAQEEAPSSLLERYDRLVLAVEAAEMGTWDLDPETGAIRADDRTTAILGLPADAPTDRAQLLSLVHEGDRARVEETLRGAYDAGTELDVEVRISRAGATRWIAMRARAFETDSGRRVIGAIQDVTVRKLAEEERASLLRRAEAARHEAEEANRLKDEFLATVSHELRTPLSAVLGWSRMLRTGTLSAERREHALETIERNAHAQTQLVEDLLDVSRILAGKLRLDVRVMDVVAVIDAAMDVVRPAADAKQVHIVSILDPSAAPVVGDPARLQQIVWNLLTNAVKFTPRGGRVQVRLERIESSVEILVSDTGEGIAPEMLPHVFERFRQADGSMSRRHGGLGLGLSIVRHLTELHGGTVLALSEGLGLGATFVVRLPLASATSASIERALAHPRAGLTRPIVCPPEVDGLHVLVVDDEPDSRDLLATVLTSCGARVTLASSAAEALAALERDLPDVLVSDIGMPNENGYDLIRRVRALPASKGGRTAAVALTAYARMEDRTRALRAGFHMHIAKPIEPGELLAVVASLAQHRTADGE